MHIPFIIETILITLLLQSAIFNPAHATSKTMKETKGRYTIPHTNQTIFYGTDNILTNVDASSPFFRQDAGIENKKISYTNNGDGTVTDHITDLMWQREMGVKMTLKEAQQKLKSLNQGRYKDWRIPSIKELFSLIDYSGRVFGDRSVKLFIDTDYFNQPLGDAALGEREIDAQTWSSTDCKNRTMFGDRSRYGVNFVDGRVKAYPVISPLTGSDNKLYFRFVRGNPTYGVNQFIDNNDGTITDIAAGLMWQKKDSNYSMSWAEAMNYAKGSRVAGYEDWRLPTAKELQSIVDYSVEFGRTHQPSINSIFETSQRNDPDGSINYPFYWTGTTLLDGPWPANQAVYVCFGRATGKANNTLVDAHGIGAVRCDPKTNQGGKYPRYFGPQGDIQYGTNHVRCVREVK